MNRKLVKDFIKFWKLSVWEYNKGRDDYYTANEQTLQYLQGETRFGVPAVDHGDTLIHLILSSLRVESENRLVTLLGETGKKILCFLRMNFKSIFRRPGICSNL